jgi:hypothetical protein
VCQDHVPVIEFDRKRRARKNLFDAAEHLERSFLGILGNARLWYARAGSTGSIANSDWTYSFQQRQISRIAERGAWRKGSRNWDSCRLEDGQDCLIDPPCAQPPASPHWLSTGKCDGFSCSKKAREVRGADLLELTRPLREVEAVDDARGARVSVPS